MHEFAKKIMECVKANAEAVGIDNFSGQNLDDLKDWTEIAKNIVCYDKDYKIVEAMKQSEDNEEIMRKIEQYDDYPERRFYDHYRYSDGRFALKGRGTYRRGYEEPPYWHMTPERYHDMEYSRDMDKGNGRMYYTEPAHTESRYESAKRAYTESKELHKGNEPQDKEAKMRELEKYMKEMSDDLMNLMKGMSPEEMNMAKSKLSVLVSKM